MDRAAWAVSSRKRVSTPYETPALLASRPPSRWSQGCLIKRQRCQRVDLLAGGLEAFPLSKLLPEPDLLAGGLERNLSPSR